MSIKRKKRWSLVLSPAQRLELSKRIADMGLFREQKGEIQISDIAKAKEIATAIQDEQQLTKEGK